MCKPFPEGGLWFFNDFYQRLRLYKYMKWELVGSFSLF